MFAANDRFSLVVTTEERDQRALTLRRHSLTLPQLLELFQRYHVQPRDPQEDYWQSPPDRPVVHHLYVFLGEYRHLNAEEYDEIDQSYTALLTKG